MALLGIEDGNLRLHLLEPGLYQQKKIETVEAVPGWQVGRYFEGQTGRTHKDDLQNFQVNPAAAPEEIDPLLAAQTNEAVHKDLASRGITTHTTY
jgi:hypothetical protein